MDEIGFTDFQLRAGQFLKASLVAGVALTVCGSLANLLMAMLYNLISDTFGGSRWCWARTRPTPRDDGWARVVWRLTPGAIAQSVRAHP